MFAIMAAAGGSTRMGEMCARRSKLLLEISKGVSVLEASLAAIVDAGVVSGIVLASQADMIGEVVQIGRKVAPDLEIKVVPGGRTRQESVSAALEEIRERVDYVLVHDAARPCCAPEDIRRVAQECRVSGAALLASPVKETLKEVDGGGRVCRTVSRERLWAAQTPQGFAFDVLYRAHRMAARQGRSATDDAQLVEALGVDVKIVPASRANLKITTPDDLELASLIYCAERGIPRK